MFDLPEIQRGQVLQGHDTLLLYVAILVLDLHMLLLLLHHLLLLLHMELILHLLLHGCHLLFKRVVNRLAAHARKMVNVLLAINRL